MNLDQSFWDERYRSGKTGWDIGYPSTPLVKFIDQLTDKNTRILIPGAGNGHEALYLYHKGFHDITIIDISTLAISNIKKKLPPGHNIKLIRDDFFNLRDQYEIIFEQTFFCALDPDKRPEYVDHCHSLLNEKGYIAGVLFNRVFEKEGPPFGGSQDEYIELFHSHFDIAICDPCYNSIPPRQGSELFIKFQKTTQLEAGS